MTERAPTDSESSPGGPTASFDRDDEREQRYRELFEYAHDGVFLLDVTPEGRFRVAGFNPAEERLIGISNAEGLGRYVEDLLPPAVSGALLANYRRCVAGAVPLSYDETIDVPAGRRWFYTTLVPVLDRAGRVHRIIGVARDVTEQKSAVEALRASEERFRQLAETIREVFWMVDAETLEVLYVSPGYEQVWGRTSESLRLAPQSWQDAVHPDDRPRIQALMPSCREVPTDTTYRILRPDGSERWVRDRTFPVRQDDGAADRIVGIADDITDLVRAEENLRQAQKLEAVGQLAGGVAHDFNNLLTVVLSYSDILLPTFSADDPRGADIVQIRRAGERAADLTRQLLAFSRRQVVQPKVIDVASTVVPLERMLRRLIAEDVELVIHAAPSTGSIYADPGQIEQIIVNLAVNARDAMPTGGKLVIETSSVDVAAGDASGVAPGSYVVLTVRDTGVGMDGPTRARIFEPFFTTKEKGRGTGLGLATVFGIVQQSGGLIHVDSAPGEGATFTMHFPRTGEAAKALGQQAPSVQAPVGTETILVTEDDDQVRTVVRTMLRRLGYNVLDAQNAGEALLVCEKHDGPIQLLLTDVVMPRMSGRQLALRLAPLRPEMKVLYMSGYPDDSIVRHGMLESGIALVEKPVTPETLGARVREVLDRKS